jgi:hypothetical protein
MSSNCYEPFYHKEGPTAMEVRKDYVKSFKLNPSHYILRSDNNSDDGEGNDKGKWYRVTKKECCQLPNGFYQEISKIGISEEEFRRIIVSCIPNGDGLYGSWRGYFTFKSSIMKEINVKVLKAMDELYNKLYALSILREKFTCYINHWLYKPNGIRMREVKKNTMVGKTKAVATTGGCIILDYCNNK